MFVLYFIYFPMISTVIGMVSDLLCVSPGFTSEMLIGVCVSPGYTSEM